MLRHFDLIRDFGEENSDAEQRDLIEIFGKVRAGDRVSIFDSGTREPEWLALRAGQISTKQRTFALWVEGWSAANALIKSGDIVILQQSDDVRQGDLVAVFLESDESALLKRIHWTDEYVKLESANASIPPLLVVDSNDVQVQGKVVAVVPHEALQSGARSGRLIMV